MKSKNKLQSNFFKTFICFIFILFIFSSCNTKSKKSPKYLVVKSDGVPDYVVAKKGIGSKHYIEVLDEDMKLISKDNIKLNMPFINTLTDEKDKKLYCFGYGFGVIDTQKKCFEPIDKYITKDKTNFIDNVVKKNNKIYYTTNEGVKNTLQKKWYKARLVSTDDKIDIDVGQSIKNIFTIQDEIYLHVLGFKDAKLLKYNKNVNDFEEVINTFTKSPFTRYFSFKDKLYKMGYNRKFPYEIEDFDGNRYNMFFEDGKLFNDIYCSISFHEYKDELYIRISPDDKNKSYGLYKISIKGEKFILKNITPKGFLYTFYNDCVSFYDHHGLYLYDLKTGKLITEIKDKNSLIILKLD